MEQEDEINPELKIPSEWQVPDLGSKTDIRILEVDEDNRFLSMRDKSDNRFSDLIDYQHDYLFNSEGELESKREVAEVSDGPLQIDVGLTEESNVIYNSQPQETWSVTFCNSPFGREKSATGWIFYTQPENRINVVDFYDNFIGSPESAVYSPDLEVAVEYDTAGNQSGFDVYFLDENGMPHITSDTYSLDKVEGEENQWIIEDGDREIFKLRAKIIKGILICEQELTQEGLNLGVRKIIRAPLYIKNPKELENSFNATSRNPDTHELDTPWKSVPAFFGNPSLTWAGDIRLLQEILLEQKYKTK